MIPASLIKVRRLSHATFETPDVGRAMDYYQPVLGLVPLDRGADQAWLGTGGNAHAVALHAGPQARCAGLTFELAPDADVKRLRQVLSDTGIACDERSDPAPGIGHALSLRDPNGLAIDLAIDLVIDAHERAPGTVAGGVAPLKLGHVAFYAPDPAAQAAFYQRVLGFRISDWIGDFFVFLRCNPDHHTVNFLRGAAPGVHHVAFELRDAAHLMLSCDVLARAGIPLVWGPLRFGPGHNLAAFHRNADGQIIELYAELDQMKDEDLGVFEPRPWHRFHPLRPRVWTLGEDPVWGPPPPAGFL